MEIHIRINVDDRIVAGARGLRALLTPRRVALGALISALLAAVVVTAAPIAKPHTFAADGVIRAAEFNDNFDVLYAEFEARTVRDNMTIAVANCDELIGALQSLGDRTIVASAIVTLALPAGTFACPRSVVVDHRDGSHVHIAGAGTAETTLTFSDSNGIVVPMSRSLGRLDKLTLAGSGTRYGVYAAAQASARVGPDVVVSSFQHGVYSEGGYIDASGVTSESNAANGFYAVDNGTLRGDGSTAKGNTRHGFAAQGSSLVSASAARSEGGIHGYTADAGSVLLAYAGSEAVDNEHGFNANANSTVVAHNATARSLHFGYVGWNDSLVHTHQSSAYMSSANSGGRVGFAARAGSYTAVREPMGNMVTYSPDLDAFDTAERNMVNTALPPAPPP